MGQFQRNFYTMFKVVLASALVATAFAAGPPAYGAPAPYAPEKLPPQPYAYEYGVADDYSKANFKKTETQDANGLVSGSFVIAESRPPPTPLITSTDSSLMSPTRAPPSTPQSPRRDTDTTPLPPTRPPLPLLTSPQLNYIGCQR